MNQNKENYPKLGIPVKIKLSSGEMLEGKINMVGFDRPSDFINSNKSPEFLPVYDVNLADNYNYDLLINKRNIEYIIPL